MQLWDSSTCMFRLSLRLTVSYIQHLTVSYSVHFAVSQRTPHCVMHCTSDCILHYTPHGGIQCTPQLVVYLTSHCVISSHLIHCTTSHVIILRLIAFIQQCTAPHLVYHTVPYPENTSVCLPQHTSVYLYHAPSTSLWPMCSSDHDSEDTDVISFFLSVYTFVNDKLQALYSISTFSVLKSLLKH